jgi:hypothetical protein
VFTLRCRLLSCQVRDLQHENQQLKLQMAEMEKALHKAAEYHHAQQVRQLQTCT